VAVMAVTDLRCRGRRGRVAVAMMTPAHQRRRCRRERVVMAVMMDARLRCAAGEGDRRRDQGDRKAMEGTDHAIS
jgi:hypothetical protein